MTLKSLDKFLDIAKHKSKKIIAVAAAEDEPVLQAIKAARNEGIADAVLVGNKNAIQEIASKIELDLTGIEIIEESRPAVASRICVRLVREGACQILMKGLVGTADFLRAILDKDTGLRKSELLSHLAFFDPKSYHKLIAITDAAQNIAPTFEDKISILKNSVEMFHNLGSKNPKVAVVAAVETVNPKMEATVHAAMLTMMNKRGQIKGCVVDGPLGLDNSISKEAAEHKGIISEVAGDADLLLAPDIEVANVLYKSLTYFAGASVAGVILGAAVPIVLTSRADSERSKLLSIALAAGVHSE
ncbi:MAG: Phosphate butyryltransferase [Ignavibacteria bacterium]|nr:Phosphate butyryltransferase [Ignavibacteria bacterium]